MWCIYCIPVLLPKPLRRKLAGEQKSTGTMKTPNVPIQLCTVVTCAPQTVLMIGNKTAFPLFQRAQSSHARHPVTQLSSKGFL